MNTQPLKNPQGITVAALKKHIAAWPETDAAGEPTEVYLETGNQLSSLCVNVTPLNQRVRKDGTDTSDLLLGCHVTGKCTRCGQAAHPEKTCEQVTQENTVAFANKPPLGPMPQYIWREERMWHLIERLAGFNGRPDALVKLEWLVELRDRIGDVLDSAYKEEAK